MGGESVGIKPVVAGGAAVDRHRAEASDVMEKQVPAGLGDVMSFPKRDVAIRGDLGFDVEFVADPSHSYGVDSFDTG